MNMLRSLKANGIILTSVLG